MFPISTSDLTNLSQYLSPNLPKLLLSKIEAAQTQQFQPTNPTNQLELELSEQEVETVLDLLPPADDLRLKLSQFLRRMREKQQLWQS